MKASAAIDILSALIAQYGDREIAVHNEIESEFEIAFMIAPRKQGAYDRCMEGVFFGITAHELGDWYRRVDLVDPDSEVDE